LGENVRPQFNFFDFSLSFDLDTYLDRNIYLPLWALRTHEYGRESYGYTPYDKSLLWRKRNIVDNDGFVYIGNNETPSRTSLFRSLERLGYSIDFYGSHTKPVKNKLLKFSEYKYSICLENSFSPGYVTEKLIDGYISNTIPIYMGALPLGIFNVKSFINLSPFLPFDNQLRKQLEAPSHTYESEVLMKENIFYFMMSEIKSKIWHNIMKPFVCD
jgi:hypothetical protein